MKLIFAGLDVSLTMGLTRPKFFMRFFVRFFDNPRPMYVRLG